MQTDARRAASGAERVVSSTSTFSRLRVVTLHTQVLAMMNENKITAFFVVAEGEPRGIVHIHDILRTGLS